jgi:hypothetical protein
MLSVGWQRMNESNHNTYRYSTRTNKIVKYVRAYHHKAVKLGSLFYRESPVCPDLDEVMAWCVITANGQGVSVLFISLANSASTKKIILLSHK